jgi:DNA polymerase III alpha subunit
MKYYYDLHLHSCLSPCGDDEATPDSIAGMGELNGLDIMALTDHNTAKNCPAFFKAAKRHGIIPLGGMELTTAEDIHMVCLFDILDNAMAFSEYIESRIIPIKNRTDIFGNQLICDDEDNIIGTEENLLLNATTVSLDEAPELVKSFGGVCFPAHIDRQANGILAVLGAFPEKPYFLVCEVHDSEKTHEYAEGYQKRIVSSSDAHYLWDIRERDMFLELDSERENAAEAVISYLRGEV